MSAIGVRRIYSDSEKFYLIITSNNNTDNNYYYNLILMNLRIVLKFSIFFIKFNISLIELLGATS